jgi:hypothetical protein
LRFGARAGAVRAERSAGQRAVHQLHGREGQLAALPEPLSGLSWNHAGPVADFMEMDTIVIVTSYRWWNAAATRSRSGAVISTSR